MNFVSIHYNNYIQSTSYLHNYFFKVITFNIRFLNRMVCFANLKGLKFIVGML